MISKITQTLTRAFDKATLVSMKGVALTGSALAVQQLILCAGKASEYMFSNKDTPPKELKEFEIDPLTQHAISASVFAVASVALGRFAFLSKIHF